MITVRESIGEVSVWCHRVRSPFALGCCVAMERTLDDALIAAEKYLRTDLIDVQERLHRKRERARQRREASQY